MGYGCRTVGLLNKGLFLGGHIFAVWFKFVKFIEGTFRYGTFSYRTISDGTFRYRMLSDGTFIYRMLSDGTSLHCPQQRSADYLSTLSAAKIRLSLYTVRDMRSDNLYTVRDRDQTISTLSRTEIRQYLYCPEHSIDCAVRDRNKQISALSWTVDTSVESQLE